MRGVDGFEVAEQDGIVEVLIDRPPENLFTVEMCDALTDCLLDPPSGAHVLRLRAANEVFCLGRDRAAADVSTLRRETASLIRCNQALVESPLVTIAEVQGSAAGYGVGLACLCDISIVASSATFSFPEVRIGLAPAIVLAWLSRMVGRRQAFLLTATGEQISAARALEIGLITEVVPSPAVLGDAVTRRIAALRELSPQVHTEIKRFLSVESALSGDGQAYEFAADRLILGALARKDR
jgi:methylglutaconyl-CoA hydratase